MPNNGKPNTKNQAFLWNRMKHIDDCVGKSDSVSKKRAICPVSISQTVPKPSVGNLDLFSFETMDDYFWIATYQKGHPFAQKSTLLFCRRPATGCSLVKGGVPRFLDNPHADKFPLQELVEVNIDEYLEYPGTTRIVLFLLSFSDANSCWAAVSMAQRQGHSKSDGRFQLAKYAGELWLWYYIRL